MNKRSVKKATKSNKFLKLEMYRKKYKSNQSVFAQLLERASKCGDPYISMDEFFL